MEKQIKNIITHWWNDTMRKDWHSALADPVERTRRLDELANEIYHLKSRQSRDTIRLQITQRHHFDDSDTKRDISNAAWRLYLKEREQATHIKDKELAKLLMLNKTYKQEE